MTSLQDRGLLFLRVGIGAMFIYHGLPKLLGGPARWEKLGGAMRAFGIDFAPAFWGFMGALGEAGGGLLLMLGVAFRPALFLLISTMVVAAAHHLINRGEPLGKASHAIEAAIVFVALWMIGPGRYRLPIGRK